MTTESDVDLLMVRPDEVADELWEPRVRDLAAEVTGWLGNDVRVLEFTAANENAQVMPSPSPV